MLREGFADIKLTTYRGSIPTPSETLDPLAEGCDVVVRLLKRLRAVCVAGFLPPGMGLVTVDKIAVSAAMAGCEQSHVPVLTTAWEVVLKFGNARPPVAHVHQPGRSDNVAQRPGRDTGGRWGRRVPRVEGTLVPVTNQASSRRREIAAAFESRPFRGAVLDRADMRGYGRRRLA